MSLIFETSLEGFDAEVLTASHDRPILVDFWADWCAPCLIIAPVLHGVVSELEGAVALAKLEVDRDDNMKLAGRYQVRGFPTVILFSCGEEVARFSGARSRVQILEFVRQHTRPPQAICQVR